MTKFESGGIAQEKSPESMISEITKFVEEQGYFMKIIEQTDTDIRFQIWKDQDGLPLMEKEVGREGLEDVMNAIGANCDSVLGSEMEIIHVAGANNIKISLDKPESTE